MDIALKELINAGFGDSQKPAELTFKDSCCQWDNESNTCHIQVFHDSKSWVEITDAEIENAWSECLLVLTPKGIAYYLPRFMLYCIDYFDSDTNVIHDFLNHISIKEIPENKRPKNPTPKELKKLEGRIETYERLRIRLDGIRIQLNQRQLDCLIQFLESGASTSGYDSYEVCLNNYWIAFKS